MELLDIIVVVVSPSVNVMKDQAKKLENVRENMRVVERGAFSVVYASPEAWLKIHQWMKC